MQNSKVYVDRDALIQKLKSEAIKPITGSWDRGVNDALESIIKLLDYFPAIIVNGGMT